MKTSNFLNLNKKDFWKGLIVALFSSAFATIGTAIAMIADYSTFSFMTLLKAFGIGAFAGACGYLSKNLFTNSEDEFMKKEIK